MWWRWKCKPLSWLWGLIPLVFLGFMAIYSERSAIENDLKVRSLQALRNAGMDWADPQFRGRDGIVFGKALTPEEKMIALDALRDVYGVRIAKDNAGFSTPVSPYVWSADKERRKLILKGYVPSPKARDAIARAAANNFSRLKIENKLQIAPGEPSRVNWQEATIYGLEQLKDLKIGSVHFEDERFTIKGDAQNSKGFERIQDSLETALPRGVRLRENLVIPPLQKPYVWRARKDEDKITLTGYVPNIKTRNYIKTIIERKFPDHTIDDRTNLGSGEPGDWDNVLRASLNQLMLLDYGEAKISNKQIFFKGRAPTKTLAEGITTNLKAVLPEGFHTKNNVEWRKGGSSGRGRSRDNGNNDNGFGWGKDPGSADRDTSDNSNDAKDPNRGRDTSRDVDESFDIANNTKKISPYIWSVTKKDDAVILSGYVLNEKMRQQMLRQAKHAFPDFEILDNMNIGAGGLGEDVHMQVADYAFQRVSTLEYGTLTLRNDQIRLSGQAKENAFKAGDLDHSLLPKGVYLANARIRPAKRKNYIWEVSRRGNDIRLTGFAKDEDMHETIVAKAKKAFPSLNIIDEMKTASGVPDGLDWLDGMTFCVKQLDGLKDGRCGLDNRGYHLVGTAWSFDDQKKMDLAKAFIPAGFNLDYQRIALPSVSPYIWRIDYQAKRITLSGYAPHKTAKQELVLTVEERFPGAIVIDQMDISAGASEGWETNVKAGIYAVSRLSRGSVTLIDDEMTVRGVASNDFVKREIGDELRRSLSRNISLENKVRVEASESFADHQSDFDKFEERTKEYSRVRDEDLDSDEPVKASTCQRYLNTLVSRSHIIFSAASAKLSKESYRVLKRLAFVANRCQEATIEIAGHTDSDGSKKFNHFLSLKRARSVAEFLVDRGVNRDRLVAVGYGEIRPIAPNTTAENKRKNRRIEFVVKDRY